MHPDAVASLVILSPHRDDAAFSTGTLLQAASIAHLPVTILNIFTVSAYAPFAGSSLSTEAITSLRLAEDRAVIAHLSTSISLRDLSLLDAPLRLEIRDDQVVSGPLSPQQLADQAGRTAASLPDLANIGLLLVPLALGAHIDHIIARDAGMLSVQPDRIGFYQDLPYASRVHSAEALDRETSTILAELNTRLGSTLEPWLVSNTTERDGKRDLVACYPTQVTTETMEEIVNWTRTLGGERFYLSLQAASRLTTLLPQLILRRAKDDPTSRP